MRTLFPILVALVFAASNCVGQGANPSTPPTGADSKATKVGSAFGSALQAGLAAAFPGITTIIDTIWPPKDANSKKTKTNAQAATSSLQSAAKSGQNNLTSVASQLSTVTKFLGSCTGAQLNVVQLQDFLKGKNSLSADDRFQAKHLWNQVQPGVVALKDSDALVNGLGDPSMQQVFRSIAAANNGLIENIGMDIDSTVPSAVTTLNKDLTVLQQQLAAVNGLSGEILNNVSAALQSAASANTSGRGDANLEVDNGAQRVFDAVLLSQYSALRN